MDQEAEEWEQVFQELIQEVKPWHKWTLVTDKDLLPNVLQQGWSQFQQRTFARFRCSSCFRSWASAHVQVLFHMHWSGKRCRGQVKMRVFAQRCNRCTQPHFEAPEIMLENIRRTLTNLVFRILKKCYKEGFETMEELPAIKDTSLEGPHDSLNCEACLQGFCAQSGGSLAPQPSAPPTLSTRCEDTGMSSVTTTYSHRSCSPPPKVDKLLVSTVTAKDLNPPKAESKVSHTPKPSAAPRYPTEEVSPGLTVTPEAPHPLKTDPKVSQASKPSSTLKIPTKEVLPTLTLTPKFPNPPKAESKVSHTPKPSAVPRYPTEEVSPRLTLTPKCPNPPKADPKVSHAPKPSAAPRYPTEEESLGLTVTPEVPGLSSRERVLTWLAPYSTHSRTITNTAARHTTVTIDEIPPSSRQPARPTWDRDHSSWNQRGHAISRVPMSHSWHEPQHCDCSCSPRNCGCLCCCCILLILAAWWWL
ncbi:PREDICTED: receptor-transporting protein 3 [Chinchilla lanigera]|nr:PREDICTED: receptor-transporting protein 3 [Chinchilla lanigera]XP_005383498.1 PREDICTED: receptor-transporting protein 3 [Chinchilla lanigera]XP_005383499.1 PREDICTED: receptor-transporting protein 3 [Chinchilla lanigera]XP_013369043.1 PREDICTED: receptor-transporting protein 3 [Chinchilla lanigera]XP_013369044.1 PREDICTED: receptor-transporting protein 3 [Chinchilla lanigera]